MTNFRNTSIRSPNLLYLLGLIVLCMHYYFLVSAFLQQSHLTDDSVQYLTLAENLQDHGIFSQSFSAPYVADVQRTPGYPVFLMLLGGFVPLVLVVQHLLVLATGYLLYRILRRYFSRRSAMTAMWLYLLQPYPMIFASMVLSETLFTFLLLAALSLFLRWYRLYGLLDLALAFAVLCLAAYVRPIGYPLLLAAGLLTSIKLFVHRRWLMVPGLALVLLVPALLIGPWMLRNQALTGQYTFSSMGRMGLLHGRMGGLEAWRQGRSLDEHELYMAGDSLAATEIGLANLREYYSEKQTHETELYHAKVSGLTFRYYFAHPLDAILFQTRNLGAMLSGLGLGWAQKISHSPTLAYLSAGCQGILTLIMYLALILAFFDLRIWRAWHWIPFVTITLTLLISAAAWADGRYRVVIDPLLLFFVAHVIEEYRLRQAKKPTLIDN